MQTQHTVDDEPSRQSTRVTVPVVPQRSARRATARRASHRRATARQRKDDIEARVVEYLSDHPQATIGDMAKRLNADRGTIAAGVSHMVRAAEITTSGEAVR
jgi:hypothetical protein